MSGYKHIETSVARYLAGRYRSAVEVGAGFNLHAAKLLFRAGILKCCTDIIVPDNLIIPYFYDDVQTPCLDIYQGIDCIYSIRPIEEMIPYLIVIATRINADLCVYHLGFEGTDKPAPVNGSCVPIHLYASVRN
jgi:uncharacterized protein